MSYTSAAKTGELVTTETWEELKFPWLTWMTTDARDLLNRLHTSISSVWLLGLPYRMVVGSHDQDSWNSQVKPALPFISSYKTSCNFTSAILQIPWRGHGDPPWQEACQGRVCGWETFLKSCLQNPISRGFPRSPTLKTWEKGRSAEAPDSPGV